MNNYSGLLFSIILNSKHLNWVFRRGGHSVFKSTDGTFTATLLKKYRPDFICYIFEKVPTVTVLGNVIWYFSKNFLLILETIFLVLCVVVTGMTCLMNESTRIVISKKSNLHYTRCITLKRVTSSRIPLPRHCAWATQLFRRKVATWQLCVQFEWPRISTPNSRFRAEHVTA